MLTDYDRIEVPVAVTLEAVRQAGRQVHGPAWRWRRAMAMVESGRARRNHEMGHVVWQTVNHFRPVREDLRASLLGDGAVDVAGAHAIYENRSRRMRIESRILSGLSVREVAKKSGIDEALVSDYCDIFFDLRDRLSSRRWIMQQIIVSDDQPPDYLRRVLFRDAYRGGSYVCEHWLDHLDTLGQDHDLSTARGRAAERLELCVLGEQISDERRAYAPRLGNHLTSLTRPVTPLSLTVSAILEKNVHQVLRARLAENVDETDSFQSAQQDGARDVA